MDQALTHDADAPPPPPPPRPPDDPVSLLLIDGSHERIELLDAALRDLGQELITARTGQEALRQLQLHEFAVILLDARLAVTQGMDIAHLIRQLSASEHTPILFLGAEPDASGAGINRQFRWVVEYLPEGVAPEQVRDKVALLIDLYRRTRQERRQGEWLRIKAELRASRLESRLQRLLNQLNVGVFRLSWEGRLIEANPAFLRLLGFAPDTEATLINFRTHYVSPGDRDKILRELSQHGQVHEHAVQLRRHDGELIWVRISKSLSLEAGRDVFIDGLMEDIRERKLSEEALVQKAEELARTNAELEQFAYIASHDLQEPLRMVASYSSLLARRYSSQLDEQARGYIGMLIESSGRMQSLIRDILALSRVGRIETPALMHCDEVVARAIFNLQTMIQESGARVLVDSLPSVMGDAVLIGQVFQNLIVNAIKFRSSQPPLISITARHLDGCWQLSLADNGIGIAPEHFERIFGIFQRLHTRSEYPGTGIGLAFCRKVVQHHGGRIWVESTPGQGSTFHFTLREAPPQAEDSRTVSSGSHAS